MKVAKGTGGEGALTRGGFQAREGAWVLGEAVQRVLAWSLWSWVLLDSHPSDDWLAWGPATQPTWTLPCCH